MKLKMVLMSLLIMGYCYGQKEVLNSTKIVDIQNKLKELRKSEKSLMELPINESESQEFLISKGPSSLPKSLQKKYPSIKSFIGKTKDGKGQVILTTAKNKFFGSVTTEKGSYNFSTQGNNASKSFNMKKSKLDIGDCDTCKEASCGEKDEILSNIQAQKSGSKKTVLGVSGSRGEVKTTYTIVMATTGYFNETVGNTTVEEALAFVTNKLDIANVNMRRDLAVEYILHPENEKVIYLDKTTDPYPEEKVPDSRFYLGTNNNDVFEKFDPATFDTSMLLIPTSTGRGGGRPCNHERGQVASPNNDGIILHEFGHHLGGSHVYLHDTPKDRSFNALNLSVISSNKTHFHSFNFERMQAVIDGSCGVKTSTGNTPPVITENIDGVNIPANTPYALKATATDVDIDDADITYVWHSMDVGETLADDLMYGHKVPAVNENIRYVPDLPSVMENVRDQYSKLPTVTRQMVHRVVARDNQLPIGGYSFAEVTIGVDATAGPFEVTSQSNAMFFSGNEMVEVTWDVANTDNATIDAQTVKILLTTDKGETWTELVSSTPNNGSAMVTLPNTPSADCKFMVAAENNIFYNINKAYFEIKDANTPDFEMVNNVPLKRVYNTNSASFDFDFYQLGGFANGVDVEIQGLPANATEDLVEFINTQGNYAFSVGNLSNIAPGYYDFSVKLTETGGTMSKTEDFILINAGVGKETPSNALKVNASDQSHYRFNFSQVGPVSSNAFTMSIWVKPENFDRYCGVFFFSERTGINIHTDGGVSYHYEDTDFWRYKTDSRLKVNEWNHIALAVEETKATIYVNGEKNVHSDIHLPVRLAWFLSYLGRQTSNRYFTGLIDEVKVYNKTLTETEVRQEIHKTNATNDPNLILYYQFNEGEEALDVRNQTEALVRNGATTVASTAPVGAAAVATLQEQAGVLDFSGTDITMELASPNTENAITVHKLNLNPNSTEGIDASLERLADNSYWEINKADQATLGSQSLTFTVTDAITTIEEGTPELFELYNRSQGSDGAWSLVSTATAVSASNKSITFSNVDQTGQFMLFKNEAVLIVPDTIYDTIRIFPSPVKNVLKIQGISHHLLEVADVVIFNLKGQKVLNNKTKISNKNSIDVSELSSGIYFLSLNSDWVSQKIRFIKI